MKRFFRKLEQIFKRLIWLEVFNSKLSYWLWSSHTFIKRAGLPACADNYHGLQIVQVWDITNSVDSHWLKIQNDLRWLLWDNALQLTWIYIARDWYCTVGWLIANSLHVKVAIPSVCTRIFSFTNQLLLPHTYISAQNISQRTISSYRSSLFLQISNNSVRKVHHSTLDREILEIIVTE